MLIAMYIVSGLAAVALILSVMLQTSKAEGLSAAMGGGSAEASRFKPGSREEWLYKVTRVAAVVWIVTVLVVAVISYGRFG